MESNIQIEVANASQCMELAKLKLAVWKTTYQGIYPSEKFDNFDFGSQEKKFKNWMLDKDGVFYVARDEKLNKLVGYCYVGFSARAFKKGIPEIILLYILKEYQGCGIGRKFFEMSKNFLKEKGFDEFIISCNKYNLPAQKFYEKMGGKVIFVDDDNTDRSLPQIKYLYSLKN